MSGPHLESVAPGVHAWIGVGGDSNAGAVETPHGLIVIDAQQNQALGEAFRDTLKARIGAPIRAVVNTHYHLDHVAGNVAFNGVPIISHDKTLAALEREVGSFTAGGAPITEILAKIRMFFGANFAELVPDDARAWFVECVGGASPVVILPPTDTFADQLHIRVPGDILQMEYWGPAHCDGDLAIWLQKSGVMFLGDLFFYGRVPWFGDCDLDGWIRTLDRVLQMDVKYSRAWPAGHIEGGCAIPRPSRGCPRCSRSRTQGRLIGRCRSTGGGVATVCRDATVQGVDAVQCPRGLPVFVWLSTALNYFCEAIGGQPIGIVTSLRRVVRVECWLSAGVVCRGTCAALCQLVGSGGISLAGSRIDCFWENLLDGKCFDRESVAMEGTRRQDCT